MKLEGETRKQFEYCILAYPTLYSNFEQILHHMLMVIGNGYEWDKSGNLVHDCDGIPANKTATKILKTMMPEISGWFTQNRKKYKLRPSKYTNFYLPAKLILDYDLDKVIVNWK